MSEKIEPALTAEQWAGERYAVTDFPMFWIVRDGSTVEENRRWAHEPTQLSQVALSVNILPLERVVSLHAEAMPALIALANAALPDDDPRKITRGCIQALRETMAIAAEAELAKSGMRDWLRDTIVDSLVLALESYLPPEGT